MHIRIRNKNNVEVTLYLNDGEAKSVLAAKTPINKAMEIVRHKLGSGHGFYPVILVDQRYEVV